jgi:hypothetical protein
MLSAFFLRPRQRLNPDFAVEIQRRLSKALTIHINDGMQWV